MINECILHDSSKFHPETGEDMIENLTSDYVSVGFGGWSYQVIRRVW